MLTISLYKLSFFWLLCSIDNSYDHCQRLETNKSNNPSDVLPGSCAAKPALL